MENSLKHPDRKNLSSSKLIFDAQVSLPSKGLLTAQGIHREHLQSQYEHLLVLYDYHLQQTHRAKNPQLFEKYRAIASALSDTISEYEALFLYLE